jgi:Wzt C-terminal domain
VVLVQNVGSSEVVGVEILNARGEPVPAVASGEYTRLEQVALGDFQPGDELEVDFRMECWLTPQAYTLTVATQNADGTSHDWLDDAIAFKMVDRRAAAGVANLRARVEWRVSR